MELVESFEEEGRWRFSASTRWEKQIRPVLENNCTAWQIYITLNSTFHIPAPTGIRFHSDLCHLPFTPGGASRCLDFVCITLALLNGLSISFSFIFQKCYQWELVNYFLVYPIQGKYHWGQFALGCWSDKHIMVRVIEQIPHQSFKRLPKCTIERTIDWLLAKTEQIPHCTRMPFYCNTPQYWLR